MIYYNTNEMFKFRAVTQNLKLSAPVWHKIQSFGICKQRRVHRGCRGGKGMSKLAKHRKSSKNSKAMVKLGLINCQSARKKTDIIKDHIKDNDLDILALTETWFNSTQDQKSVEI